MMKESDIKSPEAPNIVRKKLRKDSKTPLKEKFVQIYEGFFNGDDPSIGNSNFWDELFLLKVNTTFLDRCIAAMSEEQLFSIKDKLNIIFSHCCGMLHDENSIRIGNALSTLCTFVRALSLKKNSNTGFDQIGLLVVMEKADAQFAELFSALIEILSANYSVLLKTLALKLSVILSVFNESVNSNTILSYMMSFDLFDAVLRVLIEFGNKEAIFNDAFVILILLMSYHKYESPNPYAKRLAELDDELVLNNIGSVFSNAFSIYNRYFESELNPVKQSKGGFLSSITSWFGSDNTSKSNTKSWNQEASCPALLVMYEALHLNRNFFTVICYLEPSSNLDITSMIALTKDPAASLEAVQTSALSNHTAVPTNLLCKFLSFASYVFQSIKDERSFENAKLCFIILTCICEDSYASAFLHDPNRSFIVNLYRRPTRHKRPQSETANAGLNRPLACTVLDLINEFLSGNLKRSLQMDLLSKSVGIITRLLCYQKRSRVRLNHNWKELWSSLVSVMKFLLSNEASIVDKNNIYIICDQIINVFNLFITYGDTFLPHPTSYDELYYEIIRMHEVFENLYESAKRHHVSEGEWKESARRLINDLANILSIVHHFSPKIEAFTVENQIVSVTPEQVLNVIKNNYDTLVLKLQESLDQYDRYIENPKEATFFKSSVRQLVAETRQNMSISQFEYQSISTGEASSPIVISP